MNHKILYRAIILFLCFSLPYLSFSQIPTKVFEITDILVDGCDGGNEGKNEMVLFQIGPNPVNVNDLRVDGAGATGAITSSVWPNTANIWRGISPPPSKPAEVASINATIANCGRLIEPAGGILPAGKKVLMVTSTDFNPTVYNFSTLGDTLYVIFQVAGNTNGHFVNYGTPASTRTLRLVYVPTGASDTVLYDRALLTMQSGVVGADDGGAVKYTFSGLPTYYNNGCQAPYTPLSAAWMPPGTICQSAAPIDLTTFLTGSSGGTWSGAGVTGNLFDPSSQLGSISITYTAGNGACTTAETHAIIVAANADASWTAPAPICQSLAPINLDALITGTTGGVWSGTGVSGNTFNPSGLSGNYSITYDVGTAPCNASTTQIIQVITAGDASWTNPGTLCPESLVTNLGALITGNPGGSWSGTGITDSVAGLFDASLSGPGSFMIVYTISGACGAADSSIITVAAPIDVTISPISSMCDDQPVLLLNAATPGGIWSGAGISNSTTGAFDPALAGAGSHIIVYQLPGLCSNADTSQVMILATPDVVITSTEETCIGTADASINLTPLNGSISYTYLWSTNDSINILTQLAFGTYTATITDTNGCDITIPVSIAASTEVCDTLLPVIYLPNIFSPNGDNINDVLYVRGQGIVSMMLIIYDRWGEKVFESTTPENGWDGRFRGQLLEAAVFAYSLKAEFADGSKVKKKGTITLAR